jgi:hypothetical protein
MQDQPTHGVNAPIAGGETATRASRNAPLRGAVADWLMNSTETEFPLSEDVNVFAR